MGTAVAFLALSVVQVAFIGDTDKQGSRVNGFHGMLALVVMFSAFLYLRWSAGTLGLRWFAGAGGSA